MGQRKTIIELLGSFGEVADVDGAVLVDAQPPELPSPEQCCHIIGSEKGFPPPIVDRLEMRLHPDDGSLSQGQPSGKPLVRGWARLLDNEPVDAFGLMLIADAFPPTDIQCTAARSLGSHSRNDSSDSRNSSQGMAAL